MGIDELEPAQSSAIDTREFADEPLLMRVERVTTALNRELEDTVEKRCLEITSFAANAGLVRPVATKRELKKYKKEGEAQATRDIILKYRLREEQLLQSGTLDIVWGLKWLLSYVVLIETPVIGPGNMEKMTSVVQRWLNAMASANIHEVKNQLEDLTKLVDCARKELLASRALSNQLPGVFNAACSLLYAGALHSVNVEMCLPKWVIADRSNSEGGERPMPDHLVQDLSIEQARQLVSGIVADDAQCTRSRPVDLLVESVGACGDDGLHLVSVCVFDRQTMASAEGESSIALRFETDLAENLISGQVIEATLYTLSDGCSYIDAVTMVWPSYSPLDYVTMY
ncbi:hypothetical protein H4218_000734 [Coemansia sp. IMI 209128]|nr:hypothetical protein H4218_000734 [Coemansia sp. IMI 209128]